MPRLLYADTTPEKLAFDLAHRWPSGGIVADEAGAVLGAHGMGRDSIMRNLAQLNQLWGGDTLTIDRRTSESFAVKGARLTVALQTQETTLRAFFDNSKGLARGTGFLARFLFAWPESTQGFRPFRESGAMPSLAAFNRRTSHLLATPAPIDGTGALSPTMLTLAPKAFEAWRDFYNRTEEKLRPGGDLADVQDVAAKVADNAARLAALFHAFEGAAGPVSLDAVERAARVAEWHLHEARRFFGGLALPKEMHDAARLDIWLLDHCRRTGLRSVATREVQRLGSVRDRVALDAAIGLLSELDRARERREGKRRLIAVNPLLFEDIATVTVATVATAAHQSGRSVATAASVAVASPKDAKPMASEDIEDVAGAEHLEI